MTATPFWFMAHVGTGVAMRARMNGIPFFRRPGTENETRSGAASHLLVPGENTFTLEVFDAPAAPNAPSTHGPARFVLYDEKDAKIVSTEWPALWKEYPEEERKLPFSHSIRFEPAGEILSPIWRDAPAEFDDKGTPELVEAVRAYHVAFANGDTEAFIAINALKRDEHERYYGPTEETNPAAMRQQFAERFAQPWDVRPFDPEDLLFEACVGGRVAHVTSRTGAFAIEGQVVGNPDASYGTDLIFTRLSGAWRLFR